MGLGFVEKRRLQAELRRIAKLLNKGSLKRSEFEEHKQYGSIYWILKFYASWGKALEGAGLQPCRTIKYRSKAKFIDKCRPDLVTEIRKVARRLGEVPNETEFAKWATYPLEEYSTQWDSFNDAKRAALGLRDWR